MASHFIVIVIVTVTIDVIFQSSRCAIDVFAYIMILNKNMLPGAFTCARGNADRDRLKQSGREIVQ